MLDRSARSRLRHKDGDFGAVRSDPLRSEPTVSANQASQGKKSSSQKAVLSPSASDGDEFNMNDWNIVY